MEYAALEIRTRLGKGLFLALVTLGLAACGSDNDDLDQYINEVKARPGGRIEPLPEITPYEVFTYVADTEGVRSPFLPDTPQAATTGAGGGIRPDSDRSREFLEGFPLDTLRMVGTLNIAETMYGLVQTSDGLIHRVVPGNYIGQNDGRINVITESEIELVEIISDGIGGYIERDAAVSLSD
jgi:type IV pilus assembly protein PilP